MSDDTWDKADGVSDTTTCQHPPGTPPSVICEAWVDHPRAEIRDRAFQWICETAGYGLYFPALVEGLHGREAIQETTYDYKHLREFVRELERDGLVQIERVGPQQREYDRPLLIYPVDALVESVFNTASKHERSTVGFPDCQEGESSEAAKNAAQFLDHRETLETAEGWGHLIGAFGAHLSYAEVGAEHGTPTWTKYDTPSRAREGVDLIEQWFESAITNGHQQGAVVTATTQPSRFESVADAATDLRTDAKDLARKIGRETGDGTGMPPRVTVVEPTEKGVPHVHIAVFVDPEELPSEHDLHDYWYENVRRGFEVEWTAITTSSDRNAADDNETWTWAVNAPDESDGCPPVKYLQQGPSEILTTARLSPADVQKVANGYRNLGDTSVEPPVGIDPNEVKVDVPANPESVRKAAWYWAIDIEQPITASPVLE